MNETEDRVPIVNTAIPTSSPATYLLTSNGDGTSSWSAPPRSAPIPTNGSVTLGNPFDNVTLNTDHGIIHIPPITADTASYAPALFSIQNNKVGSSSVILLTPAAILYPNVVSATISQISNNGWFSVFVSVDKGSITNLAIDVHFQVLN